MSISANAFRTHFEYLCQMRRWELDELSQAKLYRQVKPLSDDSEFASLCQSFAASELSLRPCDLLKELTLNHKTLVQRQPAPALPSGNKFGPCDEQIRFFKYVHLMRTIPSSGLRPDRYERRKQAAYRLAWKWPLPQSDRDRWGNASPQKAISTAISTIGRGL